MNSVDNVRPDHYCCGEISPDYLAMVGISKRNSDNKARFPFLEKEYLKKRCNRMKIRYDKMKSVVSGIFPPTTL